MFAEDSKQVFEAVMTALNHTKQRAIVSSGWSNFVNESHASHDHVHVVGDVPHSWLFKRCAAVVHHGGAGSVAAGLRAGKPSIIVPHIVDQAFWGTLIEQIGVGPAAIPIGELTSEKLVIAFEVRYVVPSIIIR
jgi:sterol 3beta-glucosyltransferase